VGSNPTFSAWNSAKWQVLYVPFRRFFYFASCTASSPNPWSIASAVCCFTVGRYGSIYRKPLAFLVLIAMKAFVELAAN
jgi:hypothetical protein